MLSYTNIFDSTGDITLYNYNALFFGVAGPMKSDISDISSLTEAALKAVSG